MLPFCVYTGAPVQDLGPEFKDFKLSIQSKLKIKNIKENDHDSVRSGPTNYEDSTPE